MTIQNFRIGFERIVFLVLLFFAVNAVLFFGITLFDPASKAWQRDWALKCLIIFAEIMISSQVLLWVAYGFAGKPFKPNFNPLTYVHRL
ncbi:hypothetical protein QO199_24630 [Serratia bockelmannii]|uniref:Uncharacterized protein n=1 Tax=Serratia bockelmannii TaxID=2703793 RepID=A0ABT8M0X6_9GAMM|nr:hypothetical protein [Serratia bockelmannii]MDN6881831.1 hypothetical protein [Serratia bockelmannii]